MNSTLLCEDSQGRVEELICNGMNIIRFGEVSITRNHNLIQIYTTFLTKLQFNLNFPPLTYCVRNTITFDLWDLKYAHRQKKIILKGIIPGLVYFYDFDWLKHVVTKPTPLGVANLYPGHCYPLHWGIHSSFLSSMVVPYEISNSVDYP